MLAFPAVRRQPRSSASVRAMLGLAWLVGGVVLAGERPADDRQAKTSSQAIDAGPVIDGIIRKLVLDNMPHTYVEDKDWGMQADRWDGIELRTEGWKIETKRRLKQVNHGTWRRYTARLLDPQHQFDVSLRNMRNAPDGKLQFVVDFTARVALHARQSEWVKGVQLYSISADGEATIRLRLRCEMEIALDITRAPPDIVFKPDVKEAQIIVDEFRIDRVSKLGGEFAQQVTRAARKILDDKVAEKQAKLVKKLNDKIAKQKDDLRLSLSDAVQSRWTRLAGDRLPTDVRQAVQSPTK